MMHEKKVNDNGEDVFSTNNFQEIDLSLLRIRFQVTILGIFQNIGHYKSENWLNSYKILNIKEYPLDFLAALV